MNCGYLAAVGTQYAIKRVMQLPAGGLAQYTEQHRWSPRRLTDCHRKSENGDAAPTIDTVMEADPSKEVQIVRSRTRGWRDNSAFTDRESTRCRPGGWSSGCPGLSLFPRRKALWVASYTCAKHSLFGDVIGLLDGCCHGNMLSGISLVTAGPQTGPCHRQLCCQKSGSYTSFRLALFRWFSCCIRGDFEKKPGVVSP